MTAQIKEYLAYLEGFFAQEHTPEEFGALRGQLLQRIEFYQHERVVHLLVTLGFAVFFLLSLLMFLTIGGAGLIVLTLLLLVMLVFYIKHYYFLENSVQLLYTYYYRIEI